MVSKKSVSKKDSRSSRPAIETLNFSPPEKKAEEHTPAEHKPAVVQVQAIKPKARSSQSVDPLKIAMIVVFSVIILFWSVVLILSIDISTGPHQVERNVTVTYYKPLKISFQELLAIRDTTNSVETCTLGYIRLNESVIIDDDKNTIRVTIPAGELDKIIDNTRQAYNITGIYKYTSEGAVFNIQTITQMSKPLIRYQEVRMTNITEGDKAGVKINLATGWTKIAEKII